MVVRLYQLTASAVSAAGTYPSASGVRIEKAGRYHFEASATAWNSASVDLHSKQVNHAALSEVENTELTESASRCEVDLCEDETVAAVVTGTPTTMTITLTLIEQY